MKDDFEYWASSKLDMTSEQAASHALDAWQIEVYHRGLKQFTGIECGQYRLEISRRNHIGLAIRAFVRLEVHPVIFPKTGDSQTNARYGITSLTPRQANAATLLAFNRHHWAVENGLHWVRDVTFDEDRSVLRGGRTHHLMATTRNLALSLLHANGYTQIASTLRLLAAQPGRALALVTNPLLIGE